MPHKNSWHLTDFSVFPRFSYSEAHHRFTAEEGDWGFTRFVELRTLMTRTKDFERPLVEDDRANLTAYVRVVKDPTGVLWHNFLK